MKVGVTGHQRIDSSEKWPWVRRAIIQELESLPHPIAGASCLAAGADQLFAECVLELGGALTAVLPFRDYDRAFADDTSLETYRKLLSQAGEVEIIPDESNGDDEEAFLRAGKRVVEISDLLFAVWDGLPAKGKGGSGDIVEFACRIGVPVIHINPVTTDVRKMERGKE